MAKRPGLKPTQSSKVGISLFVEQPRGFIFFFGAKDKPPTLFRGSGVWCMSLTMTYSHMGKPHTTIGDASFHF